MSRSSITCLHLCKKEGVFAELEHEEWLPILYCTLDNPRLSAPYESDWMDGYDEYRYNLPFDAAWKLFAILPVDSRNAYFLSGLSEKLVKAQGRCHDLDIPAMLDRWRDDKEPGDNMTEFELCRYYLARLLPNKKQLNDSEDIALRRAYYRTMTVAKPEQVTACFERDGAAFVDSAMENPNLYYKEEIREALRQCAWDCKDDDMLYPNMFNAREQYFSSQHPEWFKDFDERLNHDEITDPLERANKKLEQLEHKINLLYEKLFPAHEAGPAETLDQKVSRFDAYLQQHKIPSWVLLVIGIAIGYFILWAK